jgi:hypothetical protein
MGAGRGADFNPYSCLPGTGGQDEARTRVHSSPVPSPARPITRAGGGLHRRFPVAIRYPGEGGADADAQAHQLADGLGQIGIGRSIRRPSKQ